MIDFLNQQFGCSKVKFFKGAGDLTFISITNDFAAAEICLHGAHITSFKPHNKQPLIWVGDNAVFKEGTAIRGGIPVCWPWFGAHPECSKKPAHGFVRNRYWKVKNVCETNGETIITFYLTDDESTREHFDHSFEVNLTVKISEKLEISLKTINTDEKEMTIGGALHSYFPVSNISDISIQGLHGRKFIDATSNMEKKAQKDHLDFQGEVDRIYIDTEDTCVIEDPAYANKICIAKEGSNSTVVWNPWKEKGANLSGFSQDDYQQMVCVETTNALDDIHKLAPGETHSLCATIYLCDE